MGQGTNIEANFTKGDWYAEQPAAGFTSIRARAGKLIFFLAYPSAKFGDAEIPDEEKYANLSLMAAAPDLYEVARIEQELHVGGYTKATAKRLGPEAEDAYLIGGAPGLNAWRRRKRESALGKAVKVA